MAFSAFFYLETHEILKNLADIAFSAEICYNICKTSEAIPPKDRLRLRTSSLLYLFRHLAQSAEKSTANLKQMPNVRQRVLAVAMHS